MDGQFYCDLTPPFLVTPPAAVTLSTTNKAMYPVSNIKAMGKDYWWAGKRIRIRAFGQITTAVTPGNLTIALLYGTGADANGTSIAASAAQTLVASQTNITWEVDLSVYCPTIGSAGTLFCTGHAQFESAVIATRMFLIPASAPAASGAVDLTVAANVLSLQFLRSGSTAETAQVVDLNVIPLN